MTRAGMLIGALLAVALVAHGSAHAEVGVTQDEIVIGALGVLTGPLANNGKTIYDGVQAVYERVNSQGGINGRKIRYVREDDRCQAADAIGAAKKLIYDDKVFIIHGGGCSNASLAAKPEIVQAKVPWVITASTADSLTDPVDPLIFTTMLAAWMESAAQLQRAIDTGAKRIAVVFQQDAWGRERFNALTVRLTKAGVTPVAQEELPPEPADATATALRIRDSKADAVILELFPKAAAIYMRDAYKIGFTPPTFGGSTIGDIDKFAKDVGIPGGVQQLQTLSAAGYVPDDPKMADWKKTIETMFPGDKFSIWHMFGIASGQFMVEALKKAGPDLTREKIAAILAHTSADTDSYGGPIACAPEDHQCYKTVSWFGLDKAGKVQLLGRTAVAR